MQALAASCKELRARTQIHLNLHRITNLHKFLAGKGWKVKLFYGPLSTINISNFILSVWHHDIKSHRSVGDTSVYNKNGQVFPDKSPCAQVHFHSGKFSTERTFCKMWLADTNSQLEKNLEVESFLLLTMIFLENVLSMEIFLNDIFGKFSVHGNFSWVEMGL
jgi:hypothetical protein